MIKLITIPRKYIIILILLYIKLHTRVESGSDDPDNLDHLGHFIGRSSGSYPQNILAGCDPDITCFFRKIVLAFDK